MKKYILVLFLIIFIIPSIALASWWNPFSWKIFQKKEVAPQVQVEVQKTPEEKISDLQKQLDDLKKKTDSASVVPTTKTLVKSISKTPIPKKIEVSSESSWKAIEDYLFPIADGQGLADFGTSNPEANDFRYYKKENNKWVWGKDGVSKVNLFGGPSSAVLTSRADTLVCNHKSFSPLCPAGQKFYCPETGDASCTSSVATNNNTTTSQPPNTTYCNGKYWNNCTGGKQFYCPASGDAQCNTSTAEIEALLKQIQQNTLINNQNTLNTKLRLEELAREAETARVNAEITKLKNQIEESQNNLNNQPTGQLPSINCSNYQTEKNTLDEYYASNGMAFSGARVSATNALDAKYASCF